MTGDDRPTEVRERFDAAGALAAEIRQLVAASIRSAAPIGVLHDAARAVRDVVGQLSAGEPRALGVTRDSPRSEIRPYTPITGSASPIAPPMVIKPDGENVVGSVILGAAYQGHPGFAHGGYLAALMDEILGALAERHASPIATAGLTIRYRRPVTVDEPLTVTGSVVSRDGRRLTLQGALCRAREPDIALVEAYGQFVAIDTGHVFAKA